MSREKGFEILDWHDHLLDAGIVPVVPYDTRKTNDLKDTENRVEDRIDGYSPSSVYF